MFFLKNGKGQYCVSHISYEKKCVEYRFEYLEDLFYSTDITIFHVLSNLDEVIRKYRIAQDDPSIYAVKITETYKYPEVLV
jgi:hypothetical protein